MLFKPHIHIKHPNFIATLTKMCRFFACLLIITITGAMSKLVIIPRDQWQARAPTLREPMRNPVPYVIIHHSYTPSACTSHDACINKMREMQDMHQINNGWNDIGYHFAVGGDGNAYEGRGWETVGAHAPRYNNISIGICLIGDWRTELPPPQQLQAVHDLIQYGVETGMIREDYTLLGHRQVRDTECPGDRLFSEIMTWDHFSATPTRNEGYGGHTDTTPKDAGGNGVDDNKLFFFKGKS